MISFHPRARTCAALAFGLLTGASHATSTDLASVPLIAWAQQSVLPNLMFVLDDSGSMDSTYLPDNAVNFYGYYGFHAAQCNGVYYNPTITYAPPVYADGSSYPNATFTNAWWNGYNTGSGTVDLSQRFSTYPAGDPNVSAAHYYTYSGTQTTAASKNYSSGTFYNECRSDIGRAPGVNVFTLVTVGATSGPGGTDERTNFANWFSYYRTRMLMMKTASGRAFKAIGANYRVGYMTINNNAGNSFINPTAFDATARAAWYAKLYGAISGYSTPLRIALANAGRLYANKLTSLNGVTTTDPVQYSCQKNFTLLSTDGYWNESGTIPQVDGVTPIGDQDSAESAPFKDGTATPDTLADVAEYYYKTPLRSLAFGNQIGALGTDVSIGNVPAVGADTATWQHMTTFTLGLGAPGTMRFVPGYQTPGTSSDYDAIVNGATASSTVCTWQAAGTTCTWPQPVSNAPQTIDDLWHAAVNGRGTYFSATDPASLATGLSSALQQINSLLSSGAAASTSNPNVTASDNFIFSSSYVVNAWSGDLARYRINVTTDATNGTLSSTPDWKAAALLDRNNGRTIYTRDATNTSTGLKPLLWANLSTTEQAWFSTPYISSTAPTPLTQFCTSGAACLSAANQTAASGQALFNFVRGDRSNEGSNAYFRQRTSVLGDIIDSDAAYVKGAPFQYGDAGYSAYKTNVAGRQGMVYVGANDGMLHAFDATTGAEVWAYVPQAMLPNLYQLADMSYSNRHRYFVDGPVTSADVYFAGAWHTIVVGGYNGGGRGYYALDVTIPASPKVLWEVSSASTGFANMGYSYGRPEITKLKTGAWVVLMTSGYNNVTPGDGQGYLYVVNAGSGDLIRAIGTGQGSATGTVAGVCTTAPCPSGLAQIRAWVDNGTYDNTAQRVYGGDLFGNVWRFDINGDVGAAGYDAQLLATLRGPGGAAQPLTARPELGVVSKMPVVFVGTGRNLGPTDLPDTSVQSIYAIKDRLTASGFGSPRAAGSGFVQQTLSGTTCPSGSTFCTAGSATRSVTPAKPVNFGTDNGWYVDLAAGERASTDPQLALGTLVMTTNVLSGDSCSVTGSSYLNFFDYATGGSVSTANGIVSISLGPVNAARPNVYKLPDGTLRAAVQTTGVGGTNNPSGIVTPPIPYQRNPGNLRRTSWRELVTE